MIVLALRSPKSNILKGISRRHLSLDARPRVNLVEVGPRDGLQNEKTVVDAATKVELIEKLVTVGLRNVEVGSLVSPKWVPQMATTKEVLLSPTLLALREQFSHLPGFSYPVLVPNQRGLDNLLALSSSSPDSQFSLPTNEIAIFVSATESFSKANLNTSINASLAALRPVVESAKSHGLRVRGYVSVVVGCPFEGRTKVENVGSVVRELVDMGCEEVSLGDTIGVGGPKDWDNITEEVVGRRGVPVDQLAIHSHNTYSLSLPSIHHCVTKLDYRTIDTSISGLGGCPYSPGATGNVPTEDVILLLEGAGYAVSGVFDDLTPPATGEGGVELLLGKGERGKRFEEIVRVGEWISGKIGRRNDSSAGRAVRGRWERERLLKAKEGTKK
ncbi:aldolase [Meredithblackwellia eburnea MCA 4105]